MDNDIGLPKKDKKPMFRILEATLLAEALSSKPGWCELLRLSNGQIAVPFMKKGVVNYNFLSPNDYDYDRLDEQLKLSEEKL